MSKKKIKAALGGLLAVVTLLSGTSCGLIVVNDISHERETETTEQESGYTETVGVAEKDYEKYVQTEDGKALSQAYLAELPERDYGGAVFFITTPVTDYISPADTEKSVSRMALERNALVESTLNVSLVTQKTPAVTMLEEMKAAVAADSYYTDLAMVPIYMIGQFQKEGTLLNLNTLPFFDMDQPYFYEESAAMTSGGYTTYGIAGEASVSPDSFSGVFMNKAILSEAGISTDALYDMAEKGNWTWDELLRCTEAVRTLNEVNTEKAYYTITAQSAASRLADLIFKGSGHDFVSVVKRRPPTVGFYVRSVSDTLNQISSVYNDPMAILEESGGAVECFNKGQSAFLVDCLGVMPTISNASEEWGLLPIPTGEEGGEYRTLVSNSELVFTVPVNHTSGEYVAIVLSALNAASCGYIYDSYVEYSMYHVLRDNDSVNMLDMILDTATFDFAFAFGNAYPEIADATYKLLRSTAKTNDMASYFNDRMAKANRIMGEEFGLEY